MSITNIIIIIFKKRKIMFFAPCNIYIISVLITFEPRVSGVI